VAGALVRAATIFRAAFLELIQLIDTGLQTRVVPSGSVAWRSPRVADLELQRHDFTKGERRCFEPFAAGAALRYTEAPWNFIGVLGGGSAAGRSNFTETNFETPGSCMVTPYSDCAASMVRLACVMTMNCV
jgi:hypothetical protein